MLQKHKICESSETHTSQNMSCMSVAEIKLKLANLGVKTKLRGCFTKVKLFANFKSKTGNILLIFISIKHMDINIIHNL
jgi:hypothetical protein